MSRAFIVMFVLGVCAASGSPSQGADKRPGAFISMPKEGATVRRAQAFSGKTFLRGQPLALVPAIDGNGHWWVQRVVQRNDRGQLKGTIQFGNELAEPGTRFAFVVVVVQTPLELEFFTTRESLAELPENVPKSAIRNVVLGTADGRKPPRIKPQEDPAKPVGKAPPDHEGPSGDKPPADDKGKPTQLGLAILKPWENAKVQRFEELVGRMESDDTPVVLVRAKGDGQWWVQDKVVFGEGRYFKTKLRFGNDKTAVGTRFIVLVVSPKPGPEAAGMKVGDSFSELPRDIRRSKQVSVQLGPAITPQGAR